MNFVPRFFIVFYHRYLHDTLFTWRHDYIIFFQFHVFDRQSYFALFLLLDTTKKNNRIIIAYTNFNDYSLYYTFNSSLLLIRG